jgi:hypothetical protein
MDRSFDSSRDHVYIPPIDGMWAPHRIDDIKTNVVNSSPPPPADELAALAKSLKFHEFG